MSIEKHVTITILCNMLVMFVFCVLWSISFIILYDIDRIDNQNSSNSIHFRMSTINDFLIEIDPDHNSSPNGVKQNSANIMTHRMNLTKLCLFKKYINSAC